MWSAATRLNESPSEALRVPPPVRFAGGCGGGGAPGNRSPIAPVFDTLDRPSLIIGNGPPEVARGVGFPNGRSRVEGRSRNWRAAALFLFGRHQPGGESESERALERDTSHRW